MQNEIDVQPTAIERTEKGIKITWSDGSIADWTAGQLRSICPCATCREKHSPSKKKTEGKVSLLSLPVLSAAEARPIRITAMRPVGTYAYNIAFSDEHNSGLYPFALLRSHAGA